MTEIEFVNREMAESEAARAIGLLNASDESKVEAWFAMQAVADQVGEKSNLGVRGISWNPPPGANRKRGRYSLQAICQNGRLNTHTGAPGTLEEARQPQHLEAVETTLQRAIIELGGLTGRSAKQYRPNGTGDALCLAVSASEDGRAWLTKRPSARQVLLKMVRVADTYGRDSVYSAACLGAHEVFIAFDNRSELVRQFPEFSQAAAKAMSLRRGLDTENVPDTRRYASSYYAAKLASSSGVSPREARVILTAFLAGRSKTKLIRAVNQAADMVESMRNESKETTVAA